MEITDVETVQVRVDLDEPLGVSRGRETDARSAAFVVVETDAGITGSARGSGPNRTSSSASSRRSTPPA